MPHVALAFSVNLASIIIPSSPRRCAPDAALGAHDEQRDRGEVALLHGRREHGPGDVAGGDGKGWRWKRVHRSCAGVRRSS